MTTPLLPWAKRSTTSRARRSETKGAKNEGGRVTPMSGAGRQKGDYRNGRFRTEDKYTDAASYTLKRSTLDKIEAEAIGTPPVLMPKLRVTIQGKTYWVMREVDCLALGLGEE